VWFFWGFLGFSGIEGQVPTAINIARFKRRAKLMDRYAKQLQRLRSSGVTTTCVEKAVTDAMANLGTAKNRSLVVYGEPQSGKTEMMICLTAKLLDSGHRIVVHLMNDSVDLLGQNLGRFKASGLAPAPRSLPELLQASKTLGSKEIVVLCKKNARDLDKLVDRLKGIKRRIVIDDEADYATPNSKVNQGTKTSINNLVSRVVGNDGYYIGVTATPARLDLNNTLRNDTASWVNFPPHDRYTGQDQFFPIDQTKPIAYRLTRLKQEGSKKEAQDALVRFLVTVAYLNLYVNGEKKKNYTMLVHTSGKKLDHESDRVTIEQAVEALLDSESNRFDKLVTQVHDQAQSLFPDVSADDLTEYVVENASRTTLIVLNSMRDRAAIANSGSEPSSPFTIIIGGNIVSRGVTFPNLLAMFFTRNVKHRLQQDTYIQRARMFGARGEYLKYFELTIPSQLYADWHRCFVFHRLALQTITSKLGSPVWLGDSRVSVASGTSIDKATVALDRGEMSFGVFDYSNSLDDLVTNGQSDIETLKALRAKIGNDALPQFLIEYITATLIGKGHGLLAIHTASSIANSKDADQQAVARSKGFIGKSQLELSKFPDAVHHVKIFHNGRGRARLFYKFRGSVTFTQNLGISS
jgi:hypothetical protein